MRHVGRCRQLGESGNSMQTARARAYCDSDCVQETLDWQRSLGHRDTTEILERSDRAVRSETSRETRVFWSHIATPAWLLSSLRPWRPRRRGGWPAPRSWPSPCCWRDMVKAVEPDLLKCLPNREYKQTSSGALLEMLSQYRERSGGRAA